MEVSPGTAINQGKAGPLGRRFRVEVKTTPPSNGSGGGGGGGGKQVGPRQPAAPCSRLALSPPTCRSAE